ncbi:nicotinate (nicotinamide) nucleotide adenylyltransferase [Desulfolutivibrio sulfoxidireducens]|uniref:nicotinate (nicotinamide) nucleotide adenylyltransferase n=1 Tax=Desulfolutivibrio sulfoxidireducens TaxID=2773299 RepID=UPI00159DE8C9|nr:nicotinate (nicotinamide) nucleotide adenylyltransferase [Desulfolutivibrio sulfoxidireducens]QLA19184.1 nicotinate (nicotinamide) nucleotide adenylyltransferase [Desulfolutivibrio sulfoxidireducens]
METRERIGVFGGCFNPVHLAHLRAAVEAAERLHLTRLDFVPAARPPHKPDVPMLGFDLRVRLLRAAVADAPLFRVNVLEADRPGPSFTCDTLARYREANPDAEIFFLMGALDLLHLASWRRGFELGHFAHLAVLAREGLDFVRVEAFLAVEGAALAAAPRRVEADVAGPGQVRAAWTIAGGHHLYFLEIPRLDISSSLLRERWRRGGSLRYLVPEAVFSALESRRGEVDRLWGEGGGVWPQATS